MTLTLRTLLLALALLSAGESLCFSEEPQAWSSLKFRKAPKPLPNGAKTSDWPRFLGPDDRPISPETKLDHRLPKEGPPLVWEVAKGSGYTCPAIAEGKLVLFHRVEDKETVDCLHPETGQRFWTYNYPIQYKDRYGYSDGPRASPVIAQGRVFLFGVASRLSCLSLSDGKLLWEHDCAKEFGVPQYFFGTGATPLVQGEVVVIDLGGSEGRDVAGFDVKSGELKWTAKTGWGQSYAAPIPASFGDNKRVLIFQGGEGMDSEDSKGGLVSLDPSNGRIDDTFFWRARRYTSVNASSPVLCGADRIFISQAYVDRDSPCNGGAMLTRSAEGKLTAAWKEEKFGCHWMTPVFHEGHLYAFSGEKENYCELVCYDAEKGQEKWRQRENWSLTLPTGQEMEIGLKRASLLKVDGSFLCLSEWGSLCWLDLSPKEAKRLDTCQLFLAEHAGWTLPAISRGLLYVVQNEIDRVHNTGRRLLCYDLRSP